MEEKRYVQTMFLPNTMIYGERMQKNPCLSVEYIYNIEDYYKESNFNCLERTKTNGE